MGKYNFLYKIIVDFLKAFGITKIVPKIYLPIVSFIILLIILLILQVTENPNLNSSKNYSIGDFDFMLVDDQILLSDQSQKDKLLKQTVDYVIDGDTLISNDEKIRLIGIDTPELEHDDQIAECFSEEAREYLEGLVLGGGIYLISDPSQLEYDKYGRRLAYVFNDEFELINYMLVRDGYAHEYTYSNDYAFTKEFRDAESKAMAQELGLWGDICK